MDCYQCNLPLSSGRRMDHTISCTGCDLGIHLNCYNKSKSKKLTPQTFLKMKKLGETVDYKCSSCSGVPNVPSTTTKRRALRSTSDSTAVGQPVPSTTTNRRVLRSTSTTATLAGPSTTLVAGPSTTLVADPSTTLVADPAKANKLTTDGPDSSDSDEPKPHIMRRRRVIRSPMKDLPLSDIIHDQSDDESEYEDVYSGLPEAWKRTRLGQGPLFSSSYHPEIENNPVTAIRGDPGVTISPVDANAFYTQLGCSSTSTPIEGPQVERTTDFQVPDRIVEPSLIQSNLPSAVNAVTIPKWEIVQSGTTRQHEMLLDGIGHGYTIKYRNKDITKATWRCFHRPRINPCKGIVKQVGEEYIIHVQHTCEAKPDLNTHINVKAKAKELGIKNIFEPAMNIVEPLLNNELKQNENLILPNPNLIVRTVNRIRENSRPKNPKDLFFTIDDNHFPKEFNKAEVVVGSGKNKRRHIVMATDTQIELLKTSRRLYMDGTFRLTKKGPFMQLFSLHSFIRKGDQLKQIPLVFILMSRRTASDYKKVFKEVVKMTGGNISNIREVVTDFEKAIWRGVEDVFPSAKIYGCAFHWTQAVFRNLKKIGLVSLFNKNPALKCIVKKILALHLLPHETIPKYFRILKKEASKLGKEFQAVDRQLLEKFLDYVYKQWISGRAWEPKQWSTFNQAIRTNNDAEGWHNRVNRRAKKELGFYELIQLLYIEADIIPLQVKLVCQKKIIRIQKKLTTTMQANLHSLWKLKIENQITTMELLTKCSELYAAHTTYPTATDPDDAKDEEKSESESE